MKVSVIVPIFDIGPLLSDTILSIVDQQVVQNGHIGRVSLHLIFDGCPFFETNSGIIADTVNGTDHCDVVISYGENSGVSKARNIGIKRVLEDAEPPEFVIFFDADDLMPPNYIQTCINHYNQKKEDIPNLGWVYVDQVGFGKSSYVLRYPNTFDGVRFATTNLSQPTSLLHMDVLRTGVTFDENLEAGLEDYEFWVQVIGAGYVGSYCPDTYCNYRSLSGSRSSVNRANDAYTRGYIMAKHSDFFDTKSLIANQHTTVPSYLWWNEEQRAFQDATIEASTGARITLRDRDVGELRSGLIERMSYLNPAFDEFHAPRISRLISIGTQFSHLRDVCVLDALLSVEELLVKNDLVRITAQTTDNQDITIGYVFKTHWLQKWLSTALDGARTGLQLVRELTETIMSATNPRFCEVSFDTLLDPNADLTSKNFDLTRMVLHAVDALIGEFASLDKPEQKLRLCAARRANFEDMYLSLFGVFPVVPTNGSNPKLGIGIVLDDPEMFEIAQSILNGLPDNEAKVYWCGPTENLPLTRHNDEFQFDFSTFNWTSERRYVGALIEPPKPLLQKIRSRLLGLDRVVVGDASLFTCIAAAMGADCEVYYIPKRQEPFDPTDIEALIAYHGAVDGVFIPPDAQMYYRAMGLPEHLTHNSDEEGSAVQFAIHHLMKPPKAESD